MQSGTRNGQMSHKHKFFCHSLYNGHVMEMNCGQALTILPTVNPPKCQEQFRMFRNFVLELIFLITESHCIIDTVAPL